jgi:heparan-alpha-glucosaminide N-acetyltransferase
MIKTSEPAAASARLASIDAYRGLVMFLMMAEVLRSWEVARALPESWFWRWMAAAQAHVEWAGCSLHDLIQPSFSFLVGVALPYSIASRRGRGESQSQMMVHALWRALCLVMLGLFLRSVGRPETNWTFEDTLTQIGLGYPFLFLLGFYSARVQWRVLTVILVGYWAAWAIYPASAPDALAVTPGVDATWTHHAQGFAAHWNKNVNLGAAFDSWFLNLFPRTTPFLANPGGYVTLNFVPTLGTMVIGLLVGGWLRGSFTVEQRVRSMLVGGVLGVATGYALHQVGMCPLVKRIWTPSWTIFSGGCCMLTMAALYTIVDVKKWRRWAFPFCVIGMNSIAAYIIAHLFEQFVVSSLTTHLGESAYNIPGEAVGPFIRGTLVLIVFWVFLYWMYRRSLFLKV